MEAVSVTFMQHLHKLLDQNNEVRSQAEQELNAMVDSQPQQLFVDLLQVTSIS